MSAKKRNPLGRLFWCCILVVNIVVCVGAFASAYGGLVNPSTTTLPSFAVMAFPAFAVAVPLLMLIDYIVARWLALLPLAVIVFCAPSFMTFCPLNFTTDTTVATIPNERRFSLATYNVAGFTNLTTNAYATRNIDSTDNPAITWILRKTPDFVCLQEAGAGDLKNNRNINHEQLDSLERNYRYRAMTASGVSLLSKVPVRNVANGIASEESFDIETFETAIDGRALTIVNLHFQSLGLSQSDKDLYKDLTKGGPSKREIKEFKADVYTKLSSAFRKRAAQARKVRAYLATLEGDVVLCGDFNDVPTCYAARQIQAEGFADAYREGAFGPTWTFNRERMFFRIDQIFYRGNFEALRTISDRNRGSDHYPLLTWFEWK